MKFLRYAVCIDIETHKEILFEIWTDGVGSFRLPNNFQLTLF